jgi:undecaprenyl-diphosphatase
VLTFFQAIVIGLLQGFSELFPISSLGHSVLIPGLLGWHNLVNGQSANKSFYLSFVVGLHVATALALAVFFWRDWVRIISGFFTTLRTRRIETPDQRMAWLLITATIPAGLVGLIFENKFRVLFAKPEAAALFLTANGVILAAGELLRRHQSRHPAVAEPPPIPTAVLLTGGPSSEPGRSLDALQYRETVLIGTAQILALFAGISRSGITMVAGLLRGLNHEDAARFSFLLATPVILAAGLLKVPDLLGPLGNGIRWQVLAGSVAAALSAYISVRFLVRWFQTRTLWPFAVYCLVAGIACTIYFQ